MAKVIVSPEATKEFDAMPRPIQTRILAIYERLEDWPAVSGAKRLRGNLAGHYRIRTGDYRLQFRVDGETVVVERIGHRDGFYEG